MVWRTRKTQLEGVRRSYGAQVLPAEDPPRQTSCLITSPEPRAMDAFEVLQMLGRGSFGVAHKVRRVMDGLHCVVKRVNTADSDVHTKKLAAHEVYSCAPHSSARHFAVLARELLVATTCELASWRCPTCGRTRSCGMVSRHGITHPPTQVEILRLFRHKYIVGYYDSFYEDGDLHIVMEYADGGCLYAIGAPQPASTSTVVDRYRRRADGARAWSWILIRRLPRLPPRVTV